MSTETIPLAEIGMGLGVLAVIGTAFVAFFKWMWPNYRGSVMEENPSVKQQFSQALSAMETRFQNRVDSLEKDTREGFERLERRILSAEQARGDSRERLASLEAKTAANHESLANLLQTQREQSAKLDELLRLLAVRS